jgi:protein phosphatase 2C family protein 2/3
VEANDFPQLPKTLHSISNFESAKHSLKANGIIKAYSASTNQGPVRDYNEDRVAIILNIAKPEHCNEWRKAAYFGVFDGHGGVDCADFLRDNLHNFITREKSYFFAYIGSLTV